MAEPSPESEIDDTEHFENVPSVLIDAERPSSPAKDDTLKPWEYTDALEEKSGSSASDDDVEVLEELVPLDEQRRIIDELLQKERQNVQEGSELNVIFLAWWTNFTQGDFADAREAKKLLGPIDPTGILTEGGFFCDFNKFELYSMMPEIFNTLVSWYGLKEGTQPVVTYAINNSDGIPVPEYSKPFFQLHHLTSEPSPTSRYSHTSYAQIPSFTISSLYTFSGLVQACILKLDEKEKLSIDREAFAKKKFRVWVVSGPNMVGLDYSITPSDFQELEYRALIKKQHLSSLIKDSGLAASHLVIEEKVVDSKNPGKSYWPSEYFIQFPPSPSDGRVGLQNLGNTCYMNSALQCLVHIPEVTHYFLFNCYKNELNPHNPLGMSGKVAESFANLIHSLFDKKSNRSTAFSPREFKQTIGHFNSMFSGYHQQDSQEFFAFLLDGLHEDLNRIIKKPITEKPELGEKDAHDLAKIEDLAIKSWEQHKLRNDSIIIDLFVGQYKSTLICPECSKVSITFDPFSDLTLPLPVDNFWSAKILLLLENGPVQEFEVELPKSSTYQTLKSYVAEKLNLNTDHLLTMEIWSDQFYRNFESSSSKSGYLPISDLIAENDKIVIYEIQHNEDDLIVPVLNTVVPDSGIPSAFSLPFFISLTPEEQNSFGAIRKKLEHRYEQLSTFDYFSKNRQTATPTLSDFPGLSQDSNITDYESDIKYADPNVSADQFFKVKLFDSSRAVRTRKKSFNFSRTMMLRSGRHEDDEEDCKVWTPHTNNAFSKLPDLLDSLSEGKKLLYLYANRSKAPEEEDVNVEDNLHADPDCVKSNEKDDTTNVLATPDIGRKISPVQDSSDSETSMNLEIEPLFTVSDPELEDDNAIEEVGSPVDYTMGSTANAPSPVETLIKPRQAIVCEWDSDSFDIFFSGLEAEGAGGVNTWSNPNVLANEEVEALKKKREELKKHNLTLDECLQLFSKPEVLSDQDLWYCSNCKEHRQATKQIEIWNTPDILSIHLKRFENQRSFSDKIDAVVDFPIEGLDIYPYLASTTKDENETIYDLFAVDNHFGGIGGGHYTSYVKNFVDNKWYYYDDSRVTATTPEKAITGAAYLLFYRKRSSDFLGGAKFAKMLKQARDLHDEEEQFEQQKLHQLYEANKDESSDDGDYSDIDEDVESAGEADSDNGNVSSIPVGTDSDNGNVSSIPVGTDEEDGSATSRRKQRLLSRGLKYNPDLADISIVASDIEEVTGAESAHSSDDNSSNYSCSVNAPISLPNGSIMSPR